MPTDNVLCRECIPTFVMYMYMYMYLQTMLCARSICVVPTDNALCKEYMDIYTYRQCALTRHVGDGNAMGVGRRARVAISKGGVGRVNGERRWLAHLTQL